MTDAGVEAGGDEAMVLLGGAGESVHGAKLANGLEPEGDAERVDEEADKVEETGRRQVGQRIERIEDEEVAGKDDAKELGDGIGELPELTDQARGVEDGDEDGDGHEVRKCCRHFGFKNQERCDRSCRQKGKYYETVSL